MTKKKLNTYTPEFKESAIKLALDSDESIPQIAKNLGVNSNTLYTWVHNASKPKGNTNVASNESVAKTIKRHWDGIISWKKSQINNGILEGLNSVLQAAKRKARGYKAQHFKTIAYLLTGKLDFSKINANCLPS